jgi:hypothetical protein
MAEAETIVAQLNAVAIPHIERRESLFVELVGAAESLDLIISTHSEHSGKMSDMPQEWWRSAHTHEWFENWRMAPLFPFDPLKNAQDGGVEARFSWLYVRRDRLARYLAKLPRVAPPSWCRRDSESLARWFARPEVMIEAKRRRADSGGKPGNRRALSRALHAMSVLSGRSSSEASIETTLRKKGFCE